VSEPEFQDKFVAFIDVLGFKDMVEAAERGDGPKVGEIFEIMDLLGDAKGRATIHERGPRLCPTSPRIRDDLSFEVTQVSDCAIVSAEISPAGIVNLVNHCWGAVMMLLAKGVLVRGFITRGNVIHNDERLLGTGYQTAYAKETGIAAFRMEADEKGTPFVEVDQRIVDYVASQEDECVKTMFARMTESDGEVSALYPFKRLSHSFMISAPGGAPFDPEKQKRGNENVRARIRMLIGKVMERVDPSNGPALRKTRHYVAALERQLVVCDRTDEMIDRLERPGGARR
jgi:hypothetical protein